MKQLLKIHAFSISSFTTSIEKLQGFGKRRRWENQGQELRRDVRGDHNSVRSETETKGIDERKITEEIEKLQDLKKLEWNMSMNNTGVKWWVTEDKSSADKQDRHQLRAYQVSKWKKPFDKRKGWENQEQKLKQEVGEQTEKRYEWKENEERKWESDPSTRLEETWIKYKDEQEQVSSDGWPKTNRLQMNKTGIKW